MLSSIVISIILLFVDKVTAFYTNYRPKILVTKSKVIKGLKDTLIPDGFCIAKDSRGNHVQAEKLKQPIRIYSLDQLRKMIFNGYRVRDLDVRGDTRSEKESDINKVHPAIQALYDRAKVNSIAGERNDGKKIAIAIEGGGMRGSVAAGMITVSNDTISSLEVKRD